MTTLEFLNQLKAKTAYYFKDADIENVQLCGSNSHMEDLQFENINFTEVCWCAGSWKSLHFKSCKFTDVRFPPFILNSTFIACEFSTDYFPFNSHGCIFRDCTVGRVSKWGSPSQFLQHKWGDCSDELTKELMRYDAANHPDPETFNLWGTHPDMCPYLTPRVSVTRVANFTERSELWSPSLLEKPAKSAYELMQMIIKEKFKVID